MAGSFIYVLFGQSDSLQMANFKQLVILWLCECGLIPTWLKTRDGKAQQKRRGDILSCLFVVFQIPDVYAAYLSLVHTQMVHIITHCDTPFGCTAPHACRWGLL